MSLKRYRAWWMLLCCLPACLMAAEAPYAFRLDNGLRVVIQQDARAPMVMTQVWYRVGSADEPVGLTGISHLLEHMMFKGTAKVPAGEFSRLVAHVGGDDNAYTTDEFTVYFQEHLANRLPMALELEADRMHNLQVSEEELQRERQVVIEERRWRTDDRPQSKAYERFKLLLYPSSSQRVPTIGWMQDLDNITLADVQAWYSRWYAPNNATLVIVGQVDVAAAEAAVRQYFAAIPARPLPERKPTQEFDAYGERLLTLSLDAPTANLFMGFNWPSLQSTRGADDAIGLSVLAAVLDGGMSARLERSLVRSGRIMAVSSSYDLLAAGDTALFISAVPATGQDLLDLRDALLAELQRVVSEPPTAEELSRVQATLMAQRYFAQDSLSEQARWLGQLASLGLPLNWLSTYRQRVSEVTSEQVSALAKRYLSRERLAVALLPAKVAEVSP